MAKVQIARTEATRALGTVQIARTEATTPSVTATQRIQIARADATTSSATAPVITTATVSAASADPFDVVTMTLSITGAYNQVVWSQQPTEAPPVSLFGPDTAMSYIAPAVLDGADVRFAVTATGPGGTSDPAFLQVLVAGQVDWFHDGAKWAPSGQVIAL